jgi:hypothetical protein
MAVAIVAAATLPITRTIAATTCGARFLWPLLLLTLIVDDAALGVHLRLAFLTEHKELLKGGVYLLFPSGNLGEPQVTLGDLRGTFEEPRGTFMEPSGKPRGSFQDPRNPRGTQKTTFNWGTTNTCTCVACRCI